MRVKRFEWEGPFETGRAIREWTATTVEQTNVLPILERVRSEGDSAVLAFSAEYDATDRPQESLRVDPARAYKALSDLAPAMKKALEVSAANIQAVAEAQVETGTRVVDLPQGQTVSVREIPVAAAGIYAPRGRAAYPSSVLMCALPARAAGVERIALASPPDPNGQVHPLVLAAAAFCGIEEIYAMGGAHAIAALGFGTETISAVDVIAGPGNTWVQEAKRLVNGFVGIDSYAGPSELMIVVDSRADARWAALDLCAQAEHGANSPLVLAAVDDIALDAVVEVAEGEAQSRALPDAPLALVRAPGVAAAVELANVFAPEHLELMVDRAGQHASQVRSAGCIFAGEYGATAFGDYAAGSNHVLPTIRAGRFSGPLGPHTFRRKISTVEVSAEAAAKLAPHVDTIARAEGFPVHGESAIIRAKS